MRERKEEEENMTKLYIAHSLKEEMISTCYYDRVTSKYESQNFTEKLASILKGWSSLNNNKKMKRFSTSYTGFSSLWSWRSRKDFNIYLRGMGRTYIGENEGEGKDKGASFSWFSLLERFSLFVFMGGWVWLVVVTFTLKMIRTLRIVILCKASYIFYNNNFFL